MTVRYRPLAQSIPGAATLTDFYTVPAGYQTVTSGITITNQSAVATTVRVSVAVQGLADTPKQYLIYDAAVAGNVYATALKGLTLQAGDVVRVYATLATISFNLFGAEILSS